MPISESRWLWTRALRGALVAILAASPAVRAQDGETVPAEPPDGTRAEVVVIGTGGTIAGLSDTEVSFQRYRSGTLPIDSMVSALPRLEQVADVSTVQFGNKGSSGYTIEELYELSLRVDRALEGADGAVVTSGTDTMEEIAYFLDLTVRSPKPVVVTGAMRPWTVIGSDAPANLFNAIRLAASGATTHFGAVVMLNDVIHTARAATKTNSYRLDTFESRIVGAVGYIDGERIRIYRAPGRALRAENWTTPFDLRMIGADDLPRVEIIYSYQEAGGEAIDAFAEAGVRGFVTAGTGAGGISRAQSEAAGRAIEDGAIFVATTRTGSGSVYRGGREGRIGGGNLMPQKARLVLLLAMAFSDDFDQIERWVADYGRIRVPTPVRPLRRPVPAERPFGEDSPAGVPPALGVDPPAGGAQGGPGGSRG